MGDSSDIKVKRISKECFETYLKINMIGYYKEDGKIHITHGSKEGEICCHVFLKHVELPENIVFENDGYVGFYKGIDTVPKNTVFKNKGAVYVDYVDTIESNVQFLNRGSVFTLLVKEIKKDVIIRNVGFFGIYPKDTKVDIDNLIKNNIDQINSETTRISISF